MFPLTPRARLIRDAVFFTPLFLLTLTALLLTATGVWPSGIVGLVLLAVVTLLFGYQGIQSLRDLRAQPRVVEGTVTKRWTKRELIVTKSHYLTVEKMIYRIPIEAYLEIRESDRARIVAYPHTATVVSAERLERTEPAAPTAQGEAGAVPSGRARLLRTARATPRGRAASGTEAERAERAADTFHDPSS